MTKKLFLMLLMLAMAFSLVVAGCTSDDEESDGDTEDGDTEDGDVNDGDVTDGDVTDGDVTDGDVTGCSGACDAASDVAKCSGDDACVCENGTWVLYDCDVICDTEASQGCGFNDQYGFDYCLCGGTEDGDVTDGDTTDGDVTDGDVTDGDVTDGDVTDGDVTDGDVTDGDVTDGDIEPPNDCNSGRKEECNPETDGGFCSTEDNMWLCGCDPETLTYVPLSCNDICVEGGYDRAAECGNNPDTGFDVCYCMNGECASDDDCGQGEICVNIDPGDGSDPATECIQGCDISTCGPNDAYGCTDFAPAGSAPVGLCLDFDTAPECDTPQAACIDENHYCYPLRDYNLCWEYCDAIANSCTGENELCLPLTNSATGEISGGGCL